jgi:hypothetical protein
MTQHAGLTTKRWGQFPHFQRVLMIANEMNRATRLMGHGDVASRRLAYERVLRLVDLTVAVAERRSVRHELLRWRDLVAAMFLEEAAQPDAHRAALRALLQQTPTSAAQISYLGC